MFKKIISTVLAMACLLTTTVMAHPFTDVGEHWAAEEIEYAHTNKIVNGYGDGLFKPNANITRAEFVKMLVSVVGENLEIDVTEIKDDSHWAAPYNNFAVESGLFIPIKDTAYDGISPAVLEGENYNTPIKRWEMAYMLFTSISAIFGQYPELVDYNDSTVTNEVYGELIDMAVAGCIGSGLIKGDENGNFNPSRQGTRAEAVTVINRLDRLIKSALAEAEAEYKKAEEEVNSKVKEYTEIPSGNPKVKVEMEDGKKFTIELYPEYAPQTVANFVALVEEGFYEGLTFHRVIEDFVAQGGDPNGDGTGGAEHNIKGEFEANGVENALSHERGVVSMARGQFNNSASSQFFICHGDCTSLDGNYAAFGKVIEGMDVIDSFVEQEMEASAYGELSVPKEDIVIKKMTVVK